MSTKTRSPWAIAITGFVYFNEDELNTKDAKQFAKLSKLLTQVDDILNEMSKDPDVPAVRKTFKVKTLEAAVPEGSDQSQLEIESLELETIINFLAKKM